jgi:hypothetical protein
MTYHETNYKEQEMSKEVAVKESNLPTSAQINNEWGSPQMSAQDIVLPKILPMQGSSVMVANRKAMIGEFRDSLSGVKLGTIDEPLEVIPFYMEKTWDILEQQQDGQFKWARSVAVVENPSSEGYNDNWKWEDEANGKKIKNVRRFNFYCLLPKEVEDGSALPYVLSFKSTSIKEGKKLYTQMYVKNVKAGMPPAAYSVQIGGKMTTNDKGTFVVINYSPGRKTTDKELAECLQWIRTIRAGKTQVDSSDEGDGASVGAEGTGEF